MLIGSIGSGNSSIRSLTIGDALEFSFSFSDFPASLYSMEFVLTLNGSKMAVKAATASGNTYTVSLTSTDTESYKTGKCQAWFIFTLISDSTQRFTRGQGLLYVLPNPTKNMAPSPNQLALQSVERSIRTLIASPAVSVSFNGQSYSTHTISDLYQLRDRLQAKVDAEFRELGLPTKGSGFKTIRTRFV